ncbi:squalene/phytoene synthase family protein, partial [Tardiphaga sp.]
MSAQATGLALYSRTAEDAAAAVINRYSTSFALACRLLGPRPRPHVRNIYALVRVADEIVDGPAHDAGLS